jgi:hypothetical protein
VLGRALGELFFAHGGVHLRLQFFVLTFLSPDGLEYRAFGFRVDYVRVDFV